MITPLPVPRIAVPAQLSTDTLRGFDRSAPVIDLDGATMGTFWRVRMALPHAIDLADVQTAIEARLADLVAQMSHWEASSKLCAFNQSAPGSWTTLPGDFARVITCGLAIAEQSGGAFDPAIGRLTDAWGFGPRKADGPPSLVEIDEARRHAGWKLLAFDHQVGRLRQPGGLWLDLSGIAKGYAVDAIADLLAEMGIYHALVEIGGECAGRGIRPDCEPWWVDAEVPDGCALPPLRIALHELAIATSGDYFAGAHMIDPVTGYPAIHATTGVSVIHESCMAADAWASALLVLPPDAAMALATRQKLAVRLLARDGGEWLSPSLHAML